MDEKDYLVSVINFLHALHYLYVKVSSRAETFQDVSLPIPGTEIFVQLTVNTSG